ncbi:MAG TPA: xanthine dehydrogenase family protein molybdopterin-binding subunit [Candidatus Udaeobacter sp.]|jgi:xanthine dehydrogenase YagR molybdenum-binding subunit|nr:xanthine dehydrogenase family protein molybdopterin-binding subunit [Candidatus Udaeobacter sp.]
MSAPIQAKSMSTALSRVDGPLKVTGAAKYPAEFNLPNLAYAFLVMSPIAKGTITAIDSSAAEKSPGVLAVITHLNAPKLAEPPNDQKRVGIRIEEREPLADDKISYGGQYVAAVVADTSENARHAASLLKISYAPEKPVLRKEDATREEKPQKHLDRELQKIKGDVGAALARDDLVKIENTYSTPTETHNPMETHATIASWDAPDRLTIYDATQYVKGAQGIVAQAFGLPRDNVHVICPFVGGAFGSKGPVWTHTILAAMAAKVVNRPVRVELTRQQMFSGTGHRTPTFQTIALAATRDGNLQAIRHHSEMVTSPVGDWVETCGLGSTNVLYDAPAIEFDHVVHTVNVSQPSFMRAPGECPGTYAVECAMDELAYALKMDPLQLRLVNDSPNHPIKGIPWSTKHLRECYEQGAREFGWSRRTHEPRSMKDGRLLVGWGLATATYPAHARRAEVNIQFKADGTAVARCAAHDLGTGQWTSLAQISADAIGIPVEKVKFELGDSALPFGPPAGGSNTTATVGSAIADAAANLKKKFADLGANPDKPESFAEVLKSKGMSSLEADGKFDFKESDKLGFQSFGAQFCEVKIDPELPLVRVTRWVSVMDCGRVINLKTGRSQILGGIVMGIGMALEEETVYDPATGLPATRNLADYHVPVHADIHPIEVSFVGEPDYAFNPMGARGMGEIGITGAAAAVANAVYHATGKRVRDLPITIDKLI